jgi:hypothetical protein
MVQSIAVPTRVGIGNLRWIRILFNGIQIIRMIAKRQMRGSGIGLAAA